MFKKSIILWLRIVAYWKVFCRFVPFHWSSLKGAMSSKFARLTVIVPVVGWILIYNDNLIVFLSDLMDKEIEKELNWKIYTFYVGLFLISVSSIVFAIFCPKEISDHTGVVDYVRTFRLVFTEDFEKKLSSGIGEDSLVWGNPSETYRNVETGTFSLVRKHEENEEGIIDKLVLKYSQRNASWPLVRLAALMSFVLGAALASVPTLATVGWASCAAVKNTDRSAIENALGNFFVHELQDACSAYANSGEDHLENVE